jgi:hypothetical protein
MAADPHRLGYEPERPGAPLPAPYQDPFSRLAEDLRAVVASLRLRLRELWRRNRQGDLARPGFWPRDLAPLYWPLLLSCGLLLLVLLPWQLARLLPQRPAPPTSLISPNADAITSDAIAGDATAPGSITNNSSSPDSLSGSPSANSLPGDSLATKSSAAAVAAPGVAAPGVAATEELASPGATAEGIDGAGADGTGAGVGGALADSSAAPLPPGPALGAEMALLEEFAQQDPGQLIVVAQADPETAMVRLQLAEGYSGLSQRRRQAQAERWWQRSLELGYEQLQLRDSLGRLLGRQARVGSGMILFDAGD